MVLKRMIGLILIGVTLRLLFAFFFTHTFDSFIFIILAGSVERTANFFEGLSQINIDVIQVHGKIYYQVIAFWMQLLEAARHLDLSYLLDRHKLDISFYQTQLDHHHLPHYRLVLIKAFQFLFDGLFLFYLIKITQLLTKSTAGVLLAVLFWAINPYLMYVGYVPMQSDIAMVAFLTGGIYFALKARDFPRKPIDYNVLCMAVLFAVGAIIKQIPLLFILPMILLATDSLVAIIIGLGVFAISYLVLSQPWSADAPLMKEFFLQSKESTALFSFHLNDFSVFPVLYFGLIAFILAKKKLILSDRFGIIKIAALIISIVYLSTDMNMLFTQHMVWIMPFIFLLMLQKREYGLFFAIPLVGVYKWAFIDTGALSGSLSLVFGSGLSNIPSNNFFIQKIIPVELFFFIFKSAFAFANITFIWFCLYGFFKKFELNLPKYFTVRNIILFLPILYFTVLTTDILFKTKYISLTLKDRTPVSDVQLTYHPLKVKISNPAGDQITAVDLPLTRKKVKEQGFVVLNFKDEETHKTLDEVRVSDYLFPIEAENYFIPLHHAINSKKILLTINKDNTNNELVLKMNNGNSVLPSYSEDDTFYNRKSVNFTSSPKNLDVNIRGKYTLSDALYAFQHLISTKSRFYYGFFILIAVLSIIACVFLWKSYKEKK